MNAVNPIDELREAKRLQQALRKNPNDIASLLKLAVRLKDQELKRKILNRALRLDPVNQAAREMLLKMDRDELSGGVSQSRHASICLYFHDTELCSDWFSGRTIEKIPYSSLSTLPSD